MPAQLVGSVPNNDEEEEEEEEYDELAIRDSNGKVIDLTDERTAPDGETIPPKCVRIYLMQKKSSPEQTKIAPKRKKDPVEEVAFEDWSAAQANPTIAPYYVFGKEDVPYSFGLLDVTDTEVKHPYFY